ncbi:MAG TPA: tRNA preQ1(34) S-adenosylmethionine ribosyltransferase-isomerase QueA [Opitutaceae bacterium]
MISTNRFDYDLPAELIAQTPAPRRDASRLLIVDRRSRTLEHSTFSTLPSHLRAGDILIRNRAAVLPARLRGRRPTGGRIECLLLKPVEGSGAEAWLCLVRPGRKLPAGAAFEIADGVLQATVVSTLADGSAVVRFASATGESVATAARRVGEMPLPPYIERKDGTHRDEDRERYQTVYAEADRQVAAAAPTAGLHFTPELFSALAAQGVTTADITLHVGLGTFRPIATATIEEHPIHGETYEIPAATQAALLAPGAGRRIAIGTTAVRSIEDFLAREARPTGRPHVAEAHIYIYPPFTFRGVDALITNFHLPRSTLLCLVAAFLSPGSTEGVDWVREIYAEAIRERYRFFSYGDAMLIL